MGGNSKKGKSKKDKNPVGKAAAGSSNDLSDRADGDGASSSDVRLKSDTQKSQGATGGTVCELTDVYLLEKHPKKREWNEKENKFNACGREKREAYNLWVNQADQTCKREDWDQYINCLKKMLQIQQEIYDNAIEYSDWVDEVLVQEMIQSMKLKRGIVTLNLELSTTKSERDELKKKNADKTAQLLVKEESDAKKDKEIEELKKSIAKLTEDSDKKTQKYEKQIEELETAIGVEKSELQRIKGELSQISLNLQSLTQNYERKIQRVHSQHASEIDKLRTKHSKKIEELQMVHVKELSLRDVKIAKRDAEIVKLRSEINTLSNQNSEQTKEYTMLQKEYTQLRDSSPIEITEGSRKSGEHWMQCQRKAVQFDIFCKLVGINDEGRIVDMEKFKANCSFALYIINTHEVDALNGRIIELRMEMSALQKHCSDKERENRELMQKVSISDTQIAERDTEIAKLRSANEKLEKSNLDLQSKLAKQPRSIVTCLEQVEVDPLELENILQTTLNNAHAAKVDIYCDLLQTIVKLDGKTDGYLNTTLLNDLLTQNGWCLVKS